jgi:hypothetical protein
VSYNDFLYDDHETGPGEWAVAVADLKIVAGSGAYAPAGEAPDVLLPVSLSEADPEEAKAVARPCIALATALVPAVDDFDFAQLVNAAVNQLHDDGAPPASTQGQLASAARVGRSRLRDRYSREFQLASNIVVRGILARANRRVYYEELITSPSASASATTASAPTSTASA